MHVAFATDPLLYPPLSEDFIAATADSVVLLDGADLDGGWPGCDHQTPWLVAQLGSAIATAIATDYRVDLAEARIAAIDTVHSRHRRVCDVERPSGPSAAVVLIRERDDELDYLVEGSAVLLLDSSTGLQVITGRRAGTVNLGDVWSVVGLTRGATRLVDPFQVTDWAGLHDILVQDGPVELIRRVRAAERSDRGHRTRDATAAYCTFTEVRP